MAYSRISARRGATVNLDNRFIRGGQPSDPFAIYRVELYRGKIAADNIVQIIEIDSPDSSSYPSPLVLDGSEPGKYILPWVVPSDAVVPDIYFDVWYLFGTDPRAGSDESLSAYESSLIQMCNRFWVYPDQWYADGGLETIRLGFEPLDIKFNKPEVRPLEVGLMPLPLYDYNYNLLAPIIPYIDAKVTIKTENDEPIVEDAAMSIKLRQGSYRSNPFVLSYLLNTSLYFIGTYKYRVTVTLPDGSTRTSGNFNLTIS